MNGRGFDVQPRRLGMVVGGSLTRGIEVRLEGSVSVEEMAVGRFVTIQGKNRRFFGVITDVALAHSDPQLAITPPDVSDPFIREVLEGVAAFGTIHVMPYLSLGLGDESLLEGPAPAKSIPPHYAEARETDAKEIEQLFGANDAKHIWIGSPLDMEEAPVCLDAERLVERSTGVFGKTGTGKSFLTRILLAQIIQKSEAVSLIFDMHSEYGWGAKSESGYEAKGLKPLFPSKVAVFTLDPENALARGLSADFNVQIGYDEIRADDIAALAGTLGINETQVQAAERLERRLGRTWLSQFLKTDDPEAFAGGAEHEGTINALHRRLQRLQAFGFITEKAQEDAVKRLMEYLDRGTHVVLEFGRYRNNLGAYILAANLLTRRIHEAYVERMERAQGRAGGEPRPLGVGIEAAHKFLSPEVAGFTSFGIIARELRKYNVTLLIVDQRPSGIDSEVLSQIGTKIVCLLEDERDIEAALAGVSGARELRAVLSKLETKQQALIYGHAVPMPVVIKTRTYDAGFYASVGFEEPRARKARIERDADDLFKKR